MADALFTTTQQRVPSLLFGQPDRSFFTKELIDLARSGSGAVQRELARLRDSGLIVQTMLGNRKHYQANAQAPIFVELRSIAAKMLGPADALRQALAPVADELQLALLYGSVAKRSDTARSDFDLLLVSDTLRWSRSMPYWLRRRNSWAARSTLRCTRRPSSGNGWYTATPS